MEKQHREQFMPWDSPSGTLHFAVVVDGVERAARVTRDCLADHCGMDALAEGNGGVAARLAFDKKAETLFRIAEDMIRAGREPLIGTNDWHNDERRPESRHTSRKATACISETQAQPCGSMRCAVGLRPGVGDGPG